jgi:hypothetical protein
VKDINERLKEKKEDKEDKIIQKEEKIDRQELQFLYGNINEIDKKYNDITSKLENITGNIITRCDGIEEKFNKEIKVIEKIDVDKNKKIIDINVENKVIDLMKKENIEKLKEEGKKIIEDRENIIKNILKEKKNIEKKIIENCFIEKKIINKEGKNREMIGIGWKKNIEIKDINYKARNKNIKDGKIEKTYNFLNIPKEYLINNENNFKKLKIEIDKKRISIIIKDENNNYIDEKCLICFNDHIGIKCKNWNYIYNIKKMKEEDEKNKEIIDKLIKCKICEKIHEENDECIMLKKLIILLNINNIKIKGNKLNQSYIAKKNIKNEMKLELKENYKEKEIMFNIFNNEYIEYINKNNIWKKFKINNKEDKIINKSIEWFVLKKIIKEKKEPLIDLNIKRYISETEFFKKEYENKKNNNNIYREKKIFKDTKEYIKEYIYYMAIKKIIKENIEGNMINYEIYKEDKINKCINRLIIIFNLERFNNILEENYIERTMNIKNNYKYKEKIEYELEFYNNENKYELNIYKNNKWRKKKKLLENKIKNIERKNIKINKETYYKRKFNFGNKKRNNNKRNYNSMDRKNNKWNKKNRNNKKRNFSKKDEEEQNSEEEEDEKEEEEDEEKENEEDEDNDSFDI